METFLGEDNFREVSGKRHVRAQRSPEESGRNQFVTSPSPLTAHHMTEKRKKPMSTTVLKQKKRAILLAYLAAVNINIKRPCLYLLLLFLTRIPTNPAFNAQPIGWLPRLLERKRMTQPIQEQEAGSCAQIIAQKAGFV